MLSLGILWDWYEILEWNRGYIFNIDHVQAKLEMAVDKRKKYRKLIQATDLQAEDIWEIDKTRWWSIIMKNYNC